MFGWRRKEQCERQHYPIALNEGPILEQVAKSRIAWFEDEVVCINQKFLDFFGFTEPPIAPVGTVIERLPERRIWRYIPLTYSDRFVDERIAKRLKDLMP